MARPRDGRRQQPRGCGRRHAQGAVLAGALHRAGRLHGGSAEEVLPAGAGPRSAAAQCVPHHLPARRQGRQRRRRRAALHLRSGDARRRRARRPQGEGDAALGLGGARGRRRSAALRSAVQRRESRRRRRGLSHADESGVARGRAEAQLEPSLAGAAPGTRYQFERLGYFCVDRDSRAGGSSSTGR